MPKKKPQTNRSQVPTLIGTPEPGSLIGTPEPGSLVFYFEPKGTTDFGPVHHVGILVNHNGLRLVHAVPEEGVIAKPFPPKPEAEKRKNERVYICVNPWGDKAKETNLVIEMTKEFVPLSEKKPHIPITYSASRAKKLEEIQMDVSKGTHSAKKYGQNLISQSQESFWSEGNPDLAAHHTITAKVFNWLRHKKWGLSLTPQGNKKEFTTGWHCSQFALMMFQMAFRRKGMKPTSTVKTKEDKNYSSRKKAGKPNYSDPKKQERNGRNLKTIKPDKVPDPLRKLLQTDAKTMSPAAMLFCLMDDSGSGPGNYAYSPGIIEKLTSWVMEMKGNLTAPSANPSRGLIKKFNKMKFHLLELQCMLFSIHKLIHPTTRLPRSLTSCRIPTMSAFQLKVKRPLGRKKRQEEQPAPKRRALSRSR